MDDLSHEANGLRLLHRRQDYSFKLVTVAYIDRRANLWGNVVLNLCGSANTHVLHTVRNPLCKRDKMIHVYCTRPIHRLPLGSIKRHCLLLPLASSSDKSSAIMGYYSTELRSQSASARLSLTNGAAAGPFCTRRASICLGRRTHYVLEVCYLVWNKTAHMFPLII